MHVMLEHLKAARATANAAADAATHTGPTLQPTPRPTTKPTPRPTTKPTTKPTQAPTPKSTSQPTPAANAADYAEADAAELVEAAVQRRRELKRRQKPSQRRRKKQRARGELVDEHCRPRAADATTFNEVAKPDAEVHAAGDTAAHEEPATEPTIPAWKRSRTGRSPLRSPRRRRIRTPPRGRTPERRQKPRLRTPERRRSSHQNPRRYHMPEPTSASGRLDEKDLSKAMALLLRYRVRDNALPVDALAQRFGVDAGTILHVAETSVSKDGRDRFMLIETDGCIWVHVIRTERR